ncbi:MAG: type III toxin-antitoxin system ToxN/AbiQ family toxin, partial [Gracilibacteraceae bacterium]|nr:type III toxin-antitoxin system ToxN/AbiQ family toxin [Gracilibacteraceae bacterium]
MIKSGVPYHEWELKKRCTLPEVGVKKVAGWVCESPTCFYGERMGFSFYHTNTDYCDFLRKSDPCVPYTMDQKFTRPFVGIVFFVNSYNYYAPLTSPKPKHLCMKNQVDFLKINGGAWGAINFNNMIPVHFGFNRKFCAQKRREILLSQRFTPVFVIAQHYCAKFSIAREEGSR